MLQVGAMAKPFLLLPLLYVLALFWCLAIPSLASPSHRHSSDSSPPHQNLSHRVNLSSLPGIQLSEEQLALEEHYTGFLPVSSSSHSPVLFYYFVTARSTLGSHHHNPDAPLVVWLNGGPGCASTVALLQEHGPFTLRHAPFVTAETQPASRPLFPFFSSSSSSEPSTSPYELVHNPYSWSNHAHMLYIDQPVGVGFSHSPSSPHSTASTPSTQGELAMQMHHALTHFLLHHHPRLRHARLILSGESYAAKYQPAIASYILSRNRCKEIAEAAAEARHQHHSFSKAERRQQEKEEEQGGHYHRYYATFHSLNLSMSCEPRIPLAPLHLNLQSLLIGNGVYSPLLQRFAFRPLALALGLMDVRQANQYAVLEAECLAHLRRALVTETDTELLLEAEKACGRMHSIILAMSGHVDTSDLRRYSEVFNKTLFTRFLNDKETRHALHIPHYVPHLQSDCNTDVHDVLRADTMRGVRGLLPFLLSLLPITVYTVSEAVEHTACWQRIAPLSSAHCSSLSLPSVRVRLGGASATNTHLPVRRTGCLLSRVCCGCADCVRVSGSFDLKDGTWANEVLFDSLWDWDSRASWFLSRRHVWRPLASLASNQHFMREKAAWLSNHTRQLSSGSEDVYGYAKVFGNLSFVVVSQAGHMVAATQPEKAVDLFYRFVHGVRFWDNDSEERRRDEQDADSICRLLRCEHGGHGVCDRDTAACKCDELWAGETCTTPVHHMTGTLLPTDSWRLAALQPLPSYEHSGSVSPQRAALYYLQVHADRLDHLGLSRTLGINRRGGFSSHQTIDTVMSSCSMDRPLMLTVTLRERPLQSPHRSREETETKEGVASDAHLSVAVVWSSRFHVPSPRNATLFFAAFDRSNIPYGSGGGSDSEWIAPRLLARTTAPAAEQQLHIPIARCDHFAVKVINDGSATHAIDYELRVGIVTPRASMASDLAERGEDGLQGGGGGGGWSWWVGAMGWLLSALLAVLWGARESRRRVAGEEDGGKKETSPLLQHGGRQYQETE